MGNRRVASHINHAFTMIELLVVVAIIAILAAIAVPNFLEAQVRSKVARTKMDMLSLETGLQAYYSDFFVYPPLRADTVELYRFHLAAGHLPIPISTPQLDIFHVDSFMNDEFMFGENFLGPTDRSDVTADGDENPLAKSENARRHIWDDSGWALTLLTTPIAYVDGALPRDVFGGRPTGGMYSSLESVPLVYTPTHQLRRQLPGIEQLYPGDEGYFLLSTGPGAIRLFGNSEALIQYDPTNGTTSRGNIIRYSHDFAVAP